MKTYRWELKNTGEEPIRFFVENDREIDLEPGEILELSTTDAGYVSLPNGTTQKITTQPKLVLKTEIDRELPWKLLYLGEEEEIYE